MPPVRALTSLAVLAVVSIAAPAPASAAPVGDCQADAGWPAAVPAPAAEVVDQVNAHRAGRGLAPLAVSPSLTAAAEWKARHMAQYRYMQHDDPAPPVQRTPFERMHACGYPEQALAGENIAYGQESATDVVQSWLGSPGHRANIERREFRAIGVAVARSGAGTNYWAQTFGSVVDAAPPPSPAPAPPPPAPPAPAPAPDGPSTTGSAPAEAPTLRAGACRRLARSRRVVRCRVFVSTGPITVSGRLRQRGGVVARGTARADHAGPVALRVRGRRALRAGRATLRLRADGVRVRRSVRVR